MQAAKLSNALRECHTKTTRLVKTLDKVAELFYHPTDSSKLLELLKENDCVLGTAAYIGHVKLLQSILLPLSAEQCLDVLQSCTPTPMHVAASQGRMESIRAILECMAEAEHKRELLGMKDQDGKRPVDLVPHFRADVKEFLNSIDVKGVDIDDRKRTIRQAPEIRLPLTTPTSPLPSDPKRLEAINKRMCGQDPKLVYEMVLMTKHLMDVEERIEKLREDHMHEISGLRSELHSRTTNSKGGVWKVNRNCLVPQSESDSSVSPIMARHVELILEQCPDGSGRSRSISNASKPNSYITPASLRSDEEGTQQANNDSLSITISSHFTTSTISERADNSPSGGNVTSETLVEKTRHNCGIKSNGNDGEDSKEFPVVAGREAQAVGQIVHQAGYKHARGGLLKRANDLSFKVQTNVAWV